MVFHVHEVLALVEEYGGSTSCVEVLVGHERHQWHGLGCEPGVGSLLRRQFVAADHWSALKSSVFLVSYPKGS